MANERYYYLTSELEIDFACDNYGRIATMRKEIGNFFSTENDARNAREKLMKLIKIRKR